MKYAMPKKQYLVQISDGYAVCEKKRGGMWYRPEHDVFDNKQEAKKHLLSKQMLEFQWAMDEVWEAGIKEGIFHDWENRGDYLC